MPFPPPLPMARFLWLPCLLGVSELSIFVCLKNSRRFIRGSSGGGSGGCEVIVVLPLKCYLNDKVVWLRGLQSVILYTFTRLHTEPTIPAFGLHRPRVAAAPLPLPLLLRRRSARARCAYACASVAIVHTVCVTHTHARTYIGIVYR